MMIARHGHRARVPGIYRGRQLMFRSLATGYRTRGLAAAAFLGLAFTLLPSWEPNRGAAWAEDVGPSRSDLIRTLLPSVVNISVTKPEEHPDSPAFAAAQDRK